MDLSWIEHSCATIGNFDGVHRGHQEIFSRVRAISIQNGLASVAFSFDPHPISVLRGGVVRKIMPLHQRVRYMHECGIQHPQILKFTSELAKIDYREFLDGIFVKHRIRHLVIGETTHLGARREGTPEKIQQFSKQQGVGLTVLSPLKLEGEIVSSSRIRRLITAGNVSKARILLSRPFETEGIVVEGRKIGRDLGFPTANLKLQYNTMLPGRGVYETQVQVDQNVYRGVTNLGQNPTVNSQEREEAVETHILDFDQDIYGKALKLRWIRKLRDEIKFASTAALKTQIQKDISSL